MNFITLDSLVGRFFIIFWHEACFQKGMIKKWVTGFVFSQLFLLSISCQAWPLPSELKRLAQIAETLLDKEQMSPSLNIQSILKEYNQFIPKDTLDTFQIFWIAKQLENNEDENLEQLLLEAMIRALDDIAINRELMFLCWNHKFSEEDRIFLKRLDVLPLIKALCIYVQKLHL